MDLKQLAGVQEVYETSELLDKPVQIAITADEVWISLGDRDARFDRKTGNLIDIGTWAKADADDMKSLEQEIKITKGEVNPSEIN